MTEGYIPPADKGRAIQLIKTRPLGKIQQAGNGIGAIEEKQCLSVTAARFHHMGKCPEVGVASAPNVGQVEEHGINFGEGVGAWLEFIAIEAREGKTGEAVGSARHRMPIRSDSLQAMLGRE
jgi:hypothetical protein